MSWLGASPRTNSIARGRRLFQTLWLTVVWVHVCKFANACLFMQSRIEVSAMIVQQQVLLTVVVATPRQELWRW